MPRGWEDALGVVAYVFRFPPSELWAMDFDELRFWVDQAEKIHERLNQKRNG